MNKKSTNAPEINSFSNKIKTKNLKIHNNLTKLRIRQELSTKMVLVSLVWFSDNQIVFPPLSPYLSLFFLLFALSFFSLIYLITHYINQPVYIISNFTTFSVYPAVSRLFIFSSSNGSGTVREFLEDNFSERFSEGRALIRVNKSYLNRNTLLMKADFFFYSSTFFSSFKIFTEFPFSWEEGLPWSWRGSSHRLQVNSDRKVSQKVTCFYYINNLKISTHKIGAGQTVTN